MFNIFVEPYGQGAGERAATKRGTTVVMAVVELAAEAWGDGPAPEGEEGRSG